MGKNDINQWGKEQIKYAAQRILKIIDQKQKFTITVFGDFCLDNYLHINPHLDEISIETNLTAYQVVKIRNTPGAAGSIVNNLRALGIQVNCVGLIGQDGYGFELKKALHKIGANTHFIVESDDRYTSTYTKPLREIQPNQFTELNRQDIRSRMKITQKQEQELLDQLNKALQNSAALIISEQFLTEQESILTQNMKQELSNLAKINKERFFYVDSRNSANQYKHIITKCNQVELFELFDVKLKTHHDYSLSQLAKYADQLASITKAPVIITLGEKGTFFKTNEQKALIPAFEVKNKQIDIVGAGDAFNAGLNMGLTLGLTFGESVLLGNCISSITIQKLGETGTASISEIKKRLHELL